MRALDKLLRLTDAQRQDIVVAPPRVFQLATPALAERLVEEVSQDVILGASEIQVKRILLGLIAEVLYVRDVSSGQFVDGRLPLEGTLRIVEKRLMLRTGRRGVAARAQAVQETQLNALSVLNGLTVIPGARPVCRIVVPCGALLKFTSRELRLVVVVLL